MSEIAEEYLHNSAHKDFIRDKWVEFIEEILGDDEPLDVITFPAEEMQDLRLFKERGMIDWEETETGDYTITKGKIVCFEKRTDIFMKLRTKLIGAVVESSEIGSYFRQKYQSIMNGTKNIFPVSAVNLDYDGNLSKNRVPIQEKINLIFTFQAHHQKDFSLFITWPETEEEDTAEYKELLRQTISNNLNDPSAVSFRDGFTESYELDNLDYQTLSIIGLSKIVLRNSSNSQYQLTKHEFYVYGEEGRRKMYSVMYNFSYIGLAKAQSVIYSEDVANALSDINVLQDSA